MAELVPYDSVVVARPGTRPARSVELAPGDVQPFLICEQLGSRAVVGVVDPGVGAPGQPVVRAARIHHVEGALAVVLPGDVDGVAAVHGQGRKLAVRSRSLGDVGRKRPGDASGSAAAVRDGGGDEPAESHVDDIVA